MAFNAVWSIDIGKFALKAVHVRRYGSQVIVLGTDRIEYDVGPESVDSIGGAKEAFQIFTSRNSIRDPLVVCLPGQAALPRFIKIVADDERKLQELVNFEARQQIPFDIEDVVWDWALVPRDYVPGQEKEVGIFAARRETVDDLLIDLETHGLRAQMIALGYLGLLNYALYELRPRTPSVILDVGADGTSLLLIDRGAFWIRAIPFSGNQITRTLASRFRLTFAEAERLKRQAAKSPQAQKIFQALHGVLGDFVNEIQRSVGFYRSQVSEASFNNVYLLGQASYTLGLGKFLKDRLGWRVQRIAGFSRLRAGDGLDVAQVRTQLPSIAPALGAGLQGIGLARTEVNLMPREQQVQLAFTRRRKLVFVAGLVMLLVLFLLGNYYSKLAAKAETTLKEATKVLSTLDRWKKKLPSPDEVQKQDIMNEALMGVGKERQYFDAAIQAIDTVFGDVQQKAMEAAEAQLGVTTAKNRLTGTSVFVLDKGAQEEGEEAAKKFIKVLRANSACAVAVEVTLRGQPKVERRAGGVRATAEPQLEPSAYEFNLTGAIRGAEDLTTSEDIVKTRVLKPLKDALLANPVIKRSLASEPEFVKVDQPDITKCALSPDSTFQRGWYLIDPRKVRAPEEEDDLDEDVQAMTTEPEERFFIFKIQWVIGEKPAVEAEGTELAEERR